MATEAEGMRWLRVFAKPGEGIAILREGEVEEVIREQPPRKSRQTSREKANFRLDVSRGMGARVLYLNSEPPKTLWPQGGRDKEPPKPLQSRLEDMDRLEADWKNKPESTRLVSGTVLNPTAEGAKMTDETPEPTTDQFLVELRRRLEGLEDALMDKFADLCTAEAWGDIRDVAAVMEAASEGSGELPVALFEAKLVFMELLTERRNAGDWVGVLRIASLYEYLQEHGSEEQESGRRRSGDDDIPF